MKLLVFLCALLAITVAFRTVHDSEEERHKGLFESFKQDFKKIYHTEQELEHRFGVFKNNIKHIFTHQDTDKHADYSVSQFSDLTPEEFEQQYLTLPTHKIDENDIPQQDEDEQFGIWDSLMGKQEEKIDMPKNFDWKEKGAVTETKAQHTCGACWAFTTAAMVEAQYFIKHGELINFSEQQLVDCDTINDGCGGGLMTDAYKFLQQQGGLEARSDYGDYHMKKEQCHFSSDKAKAKIVNYYQISKDEYAIQKELFKNGPIAVGVNGRFLQFYDGGVLNNEKCDDRINHAVLITGWGEEEDGTKYWMIKNQWGSKWGLGGYFKLIRGEKRCGIHTYASIAFVE